MSMDQEEERVRFKDLDHAVHNKDSAYASTDRIQVGRAHFKAPVGVGRPCRNVLYDWRTTEVTLALARAVGYVVRRKGKCPCRKTARLISSWPDLDLALASVPDAAGWELLTRRASGFAATLKLTDSLMHSSALYREQIAKEANRVRPPEARVEQLPQTVSAAMATMVPMTTADREKAAMDATLDQMRSVAKAAQPPEDDVRKAAVALSLAEDARNRAAFDALDDAVVDDGE